MIKQRERSFWEMEKLQVAFWKAAAKIQQETTQSVRSNACRTPNPMSEGPDLLLEKITQHLGSTQDNANNLRMLVIGERERESEILSTISISGITSERLSFTGDKEGQALNPP
eukprot:TRINITY_DN3181_c0_g1_i1.p3 TRINITY_DN3181_c0_g1~~TRINITY_DN3181_c0_g1_i1.p3  ORF type:complete len:113 (-),score=5.97 TRINITY_DN3181_c0_g1_i1:307-645(-)